MKTSAYVAVAAIAAAAGFLVYHYAIAPREQMAAVATPDTEEPQAAAATEESSALPAQLPDFTLGDLEGKPRSILSWPGKSMIVNFWATWCAPCRREIPLLRELQQKHGAEGFQIVGVAVDLREDVVKYAQEIGIDYPVLIGEQDALDAAAAFGVDAIGFPFTIFADRQGRIVVAHLGELTAAQADVILGAVQRLDTGADTMDQARTAIETGLAAL